MCLVAERKGARCKGAPIVAVSRARAALTAAAAAARHPQRSQDGVVLGADTRSTAGTTVADKNCEKIHYIAPNIYCCGAGTAADTENVTGACALLVCARARVAVSSLLGANDYNCNAHKTPQHTHTHTHTTPNNNTQQQQQPQRWCRRRSSCTATRRGARRAS